MSKWEHAIYGAILAFGVAGVITLGCLFYQAYHEYADDKEETISYGKAYVPACKPIEDVVCGNKGCSGDNVVVHGTAQEQYP